MKNITLLLLTTMLISSCQKDHICVCTNKNTGKVSEGDHFKTNIFTKKAAEKTCEANDDLSAGGLENCHLE